MKKLIILLFILCLCSCVSNSKYKYEVKYIDSGQIACSGELEVFEKDKGKDTFAFIGIIPTEVKDTIYYFYAIKIHNSLWSSTDICIFDKPVYISKFYLDK